MPSGCRFHARCLRATERCGAEEPVLRVVTGGQQAVCHFAEDARPSYLDDVGARFVESA